MTEHPSRGPADDIVQPFQIEGPGLRGRLVRLGPAIDTVVKRHDYPPPVAALLAEALALAAALAAALKYQGIFTLQIKGDGPVPLIVADVTSDGTLRGYAEHADTLPPQAEILAAPLPRLVGNGHLAFTVDQGAHTERYQGIVDLSGTSLVDCVHHYFRQSEQFVAAMRLAAGRNDAGRWRAGAMMLQRLPDHEPIITREERDEAWNRAVILMNSVTGEELLDRALAPSELLFRLFHEDGVRIFRPQDLSFGCRCSRERAARILGSLPRAEIETLFVDGRITVTCQFCNTAEAFDPAQIAALYDA
ncbi:MAG: Hsp33 family molecular chaperone HslO [Rhodospirillales bacterium]|nr:MAG: Hsp33 family molecular chaperone HslO [Rhodospirillales bacterium]